MTSFLCFHFFPDFRREYPKIMPEQPHFSSSDVDEMLRNAELRNELEPYLDESVSCVLFQHFPLRFENDFLASMLEWEVAPVLPIYRWFEPELRLPPPESLSDDKLRQLLEDVIEKMYEKKIQLDFTEHLSDRELYSLIYRDILPSKEKKLEHRNCYIHWDCSEGNSDVWLSFYASDDDRDHWADLYDEPLPPKRLPCFPRNLPQNPF